MSSPGMEDPSKRKDVFVKEVPAYCNIILECFGM
jgi:hypothetical protein